MADEPENLTLRMLRQIDAKLDQVDCKLGILIDRVQDLTVRLACVVDQISGLRADFVRLEHRMDRFDERLQRIERRLDLITRTG
jgi:predicted nuclease with TOPRIM domain